MKYFRNSFPVYGLTLGILSLLSAVALAAPRFIVDFNTDRPGQDYRRFSTNSVETCMRSCASESQCRAFTHVPPGVQPGQDNSNGICWLKNGIPPTRDNPSGMISGAKQ